MANNILTVQEHGGELRVDSRLIAEQLGLSHKSFKGTIRKYEDRLATRGTVLFETAPSEANGGGGSGETYYLLNERQATFLMTLSRNTPEVVEAKDQLESAFAKAKDVIKTVIPAQSDRIRELELQNEIYAKELSLRQLDHTMLTMHGKETVLKLRGHADAIVETEKPVIEVIDERHNVSFRGQTKRSVLSDYVPEENLDQVYRILEEDGRQKLIGE